MKREEVVSSNLKSVGYDPKGQVLEMEFQNGRIYQYHQVPREEYEALMAAPSLGRYFLDNIREVYGYDRAA